MTHETIAKEGFWRLTKDLEGTFDVGLDLTKELIAEIELGIDEDTIGTIEIYDEEEKTWFSYQY